MEYQLDAHCMEVMCRYVAGLVSKEEAQNEISRHGDQVIADMLMNGFSGPMYIDQKDWIGVTGSTGTS